MGRVSSIASFACMIAILLVAVTPASADLALTPAGVTDGFTLTEFVGGYFFGGYGPLAQGILPSGNVVTGSMGDRKIYVFKDTDGQTLGSAVSATSYICQTGNCNYAMATAGGQVYGGQAFGGVYEHFANDGSQTALPGVTAAGLLNNLGMWGDPVNGHIIAASNKGLVEIDPVADTFRVINASLFPDGVSVSPDGAVAYLELGGTIQSFDIATGTHIHTFFTGHAPDGTGVITGGLFNGDVVVNNNDGTMGLLDPTKADGDPNQFVIIANGGSRGDFVSPDLSNGTLFVSQVESVDRLSCGPGCSIGGPPRVPEPSSVWLLGSGLIASFTLLRRKMRKQL